MQHRETQIKAYHSALESGLITKKRAEVFKYLAYNGPATNNQMLRYMKSRGNTGAYTTRLSELERMQVIETVGKEKDPETGFHVLVYDLTGRQPIKLPKNFTKEQRKLIAINKLREVYMMKEDKALWVGVSNAIKDI